MEDVYSLEEIASILNISIKEVRALEKSAFRKLCKWENKKVIIKYLALGECSTRDYFLMAWKGHRDNSDYIFLEQEDKHLNDFFKDKVN